MVLHYLFKLEYKINILIIDWNIMIINTNWNYVVIVFLKIFDTNCSKEKCDAMLIMILTILYNSFN